MPHQRYIVDVALEIDPSTGLFAYSEVVVIGPRQATGKTELLLPLMTHRCVGLDGSTTKWIGEQLGVRLPDPGPLRTLYTAQTADAARAKWRDIHLPRLKASPFYRPRPQFSVRLQRNMETMVFRNGSTWSPGSTTGKTAGTGDTLDLAVIDEAWAQPDNRTELGLRPAMLTRDWRQIWLMSMIPGISRRRVDEWQYLRDKRRVGRARVEAGSRSRMAFFDFSAPPGMDPGDPATWALALPGLHRTVSLSAVRDDYQAAVDAGTLVDFCAEYLGWEPKDVAPVWKLIPQRVWDTRFDATSQIAGRLSLAVEMDEERRTGWIGAVGRRADGHYHVEIVEPGDKVPEDVEGVDWMERRLVDLVEDHKALNVVIDPRRPAASLIPALKAKHIDVITPSQPLIAGACGRFFDRTGARRPIGDEPVDDDGVRLFHIGQATLDRALAQARPHDTPGGGFVFVRRGHGSEVGPLYVVTLAMHGFDVADHEDDYDPLDSVDSSRRCSCGRIIYSDDGRAWLHAADDTPACR